VPSIARANLACDNALAQGVDDAIAELSFLDLLAGDP
jgi:hypothetical protein